LPARGTVLCVIEDAALLRGLSDTLVTAGFDIVTVSRVDEALAALRANDVDALLLDHDIARASRTDLIGEFKATRPSLPMVLLAGNPALAVVLDSMRQGIVAFIPKPPPTAELVSSLDAAVQQTRLCKTLVRVEALSRELEHCLAVLTAAAQRGARVPPAMASPPPRDLLRNVSAAHTGRLTARETSVLQEFALGKSLNAIATSLELSPNTIRTHLKSIFIKLEVRSQRELLLRLTRPSS
jgi:DNA-binding NarL/FixJ family response regulator